MVTLRRKQQQQLGIATSSNRLRQPEEEMRYMYPVPPAVATTKISILLFAPFSIDGILIETSVRTHCNDIYSLQHSTALVHSMVCTSQFNNLHLHKLTMNPLLVSPYLPPGPPPSPAHTNAINYAIHGPVLNNTFCSWHDGGLVEMLCNGLSLHGRDRVARQGYTGWCVPNLVPSRVGTEHSADNASCTPSPYSGHSTPHGDIARGPGRSLVHRQYIPISIAIRQPPQLVV